MNKNWYSQDIKEIYKYFKTGPAGLLEDEVIFRQQHNGYNELPKEKPISNLNIFLGQFKNPLIYILIFAAIISIFLNEYSDAIIILIAVIANTIIGFLQENKASKALYELKSILKPETIVLRDNQAKNIPQKEVVTGDILILNAGDKIPADARIIECNNLTVNEAILTGESETIEKFAKRISQKTPLSTRKNMLYMGTVIESGQAKAITVATGKDTEIGKIAKILKNANNEETPFQQKLAKFSKTIGLLILIIALIILIEGLITGSDFTEIFTTSIAVAVAAIPEGLPVAITVIFAVGMQKILKRKGLVRKLLSAETLGSTSVICTDKTGTLTQASMKVNQISTANKDYSFNDNLSSKIVKNIITIGVLRSEAIINKKTILGRATDKALIKAGKKLKLDKNKLNKTYPVLDEIKFDPNNKYSCSIHRTSTGNRFFIMGTPEFLLEKCKYYKDEKQYNKTLKAGFKDELIAKLEKITDQGNRVIALAQCKTTKTKIDKKIFDKLVFEGFVCLEDPLRLSARDAFLACQKAGIRPVIITGDHVNTAKNIATQLGLKITKENILDGNKLSSLNDQELKNTINKIQIFARTEPVQKLRIVKAWQEKGKVVAMTGDGINDAPALKQANIGISLGSGTAVAKEVSDLVLLSDDFSVIVASIEEGRAIIDNIRKVITYTLSDSFSEIILVGGAILLGLPLPILAAQILWVNLVEDSLPSVALGFEPKENDLMLQKPEPKDIPLLNQEMRWLIFTIGIITNLILLVFYWWLYHNSGYELTHIRTIIFCALALCTLMYLFSCRSLRRNIWNINLFSNKILLYAWTFGILMLLVGIYVPAIQNLIRTSALNLNDWILLAGLSLVNLILIELVKFIFIRKQK